MKRALAALLLLSPALADEVRLKDGGVLKGEILEDGPKGVLLKSSYGTVQISRNRVESVVRAQYEPPAPLPEAPPSAPGSQGPVPEKGDTDLGLRLRNAMATFTKFDYEEDLGKAARSLVEAGRPIVPLIADALPDATPPQQKWLAEVLAEIKDPRGGKAVLDLIHSPKGEVRVAAIQTLATLKDPMASRTLVNLLGDEDWNVRLAAARGLGVLKDREAVPALIQRLSDPHLLVRSAAHDALTITTEENLPNRQEDWKAWLAEHPIGKEKVDLHGRPVPPKRSPEEGEAP